MFVVVALLGACVDGFAMPRGCEKGVVRRTKTKRETRYSSFVSLF